MLVVSLLVAFTPPAEPAIRPPDDGDSILAVIQANGPEVPADELGPVEDVIAAAELATRRLATAGPDNVSEFMGYVTRTRKIAYARTQDFLHLCLEDQALAALIRRKAPPVPPEIVQRASRRRETLSRAIQDSAAVCPPEPAVVVEPAPQPASPAVSEPSLPPAPERTAPPSRPPEKARLGPARIAGGVGLLGAGIGAAVGFGFAVQSSRQAVAQIAALERQILASQRPATPQELAEEAALDRQYQRGIAAAVVTGVLSGATLAAGLVLLFVPPRRTEARRPLALPWGGMGSAGLSFHARF